jgi:hypothetical protein
MKEKIDKLVSKVRDNFSIINKTLKEIEDTFVFKDFEDELPTVEQYGDGYSIYLLDDNERELPIEYAAVIMDTIGYITPVCFVPIICSKIMRGEYKEKDLLTLQELCKKSFNQEIVLI